MTPLVALYTAWAATAIWPITAKAANAWCDPLWFGVAHLTLGLLCLAPFLLYTGRWRRVFEPGHRLNYFVMGCLGSGITTALLQTAVSYTTSANAAIVCQVEVVYSAVLSAWLLGERISGRQAAASALVLAGTGIILGKDLQTPHWKGDLMVLVTPWMFQISHIFAKKLPADIEPHTIAGARLLWGLVTLVPLAWFFGPPHLKPTPAFFAVLGVHGVVLNTLTMPLWYTAVRSLPLSKTTAIMLSYPALTMLYCALLGMEPIGAHQVAGLALSMSGALWLTAQVREAAPAPSPAEAAAA